MRSPVEAFIVLKGWPTSRRNALLLGLALPFHVGCTFSSHAIAKLYPWINLPLLDTVNWLWNLEIGLMFLISLYAAWRGWEGNWTFWLNMVPYGAFMVTAISLFGFASTAFDTWFPSVVVLNAVWFSPRLGMYSFLYGLALIALYSVLLFNGAIPYAPALLNHSIDVQNAPLWTLHVFSLVLLYFAFCLVLVVLLIRAQEFQQHRLTEAQAKLDLTNRLIGRYVPTQLAQQIIDGEHTEHMRPERAKLTIVFSDVEGFTEASDHLDPEDLAALLNEYLSEMMAIAELHGATVNQIVGDGIMMFFGAPRSLGDEEDAYRAVRMALEMQQRMTELKDVWLRRGIGKPFRIRVGINTGYASVGDYGSAGRKLYTAIGVQTNLAARIQSLCEPGRILLSHSTWSLVQGRVSCTERGELPLKGLYYPVRLYEVNETQADAPTSPLRLVASRD